MMKLVALAILVGLVGAVVDEYYVGLKNIGHVNDNYSNGITFTSESDMVVCESDHCIVGSDGVLKARVDSTSGNLEMEVYPSRDNYMISVMCKGKRLNSCSSEVTVVRSGYSSCPDPTDMRDTSYPNEGCTVVGQGYCAAEVEVYATCI